VSVIEAAEVASRLAAGPAETARRFTVSARTPGRVLPTGEFRSWLAARLHGDSCSVEQIPFRDLRSWSFDPVTGNLGHDTGRFFTIEGIEVASDYGWVPRWTQPIIKQPEIGILGILVREFNGVLHCLMQAKMEPGNEPLIQLSPTVQATRSNYLRAHRGDSTRYLEYFTDPARGRVLVDVLQSEQGTWFWHKRNRNMVVEAVGDVDVHEDFCWLTIHQLKELLRSDNTVNMDSRTILSCLPFADPGGGGPGDDGAAGHHDPAFREALARSVAGLGPSVHSAGELASWLIEAKAGRELAVREIPLRAVAGWRRSDWEISHEDGRFFRVLAVSVRADQREVRHWTQPMVEPAGVGVAALLTRRIDGVLHALLHTRTEPGYLDAVEIAPTVQCTPGNYAAAGPGRQPAYLDYVLGADRRRVRYDAVQSDEGGRFYHAGSRHLVIDVDEHFPINTPEDYRWLTVHQMMELLRHSHYLNVQARSLLACLHTLW
jgi:dTDP-4-dehydro-6-deoxy-alpha-D-glucopyranose 2,3-dehydratase